MKMNMIRTHTWRYTKMHRITCYAQFVRLNVIVNIVYM